MLLFRDEKKNIRIYIIYIYTSIYYYYNICKRFENRTVRLFQSIIVESPPNIRLLREKNNRAALFEKRDKNHVQTALRYNTAMTVQEWRAPTTPRSKSNHVYILRDIVVLVNTITGAFELPGPEGQVSKSSGRRS